MSYLATLERAAMVQHTAPAPAPTPPAELAAALEAVPAWASLFATRDEVIDRFRALAPHDPEQIVAQMTRDYASRLVDAVINGHPIPEAIGDDAEEVRRKAAAARIERDALQHVASALLHELTNVFRRARPAAAKELSERLGEIVNQARELGAVRLEHSPSAEELLRLGEEERNRLIRLEELARDFAAVRHAQMALYGLEELAPSHCFANAEELTTFGKDDPWPGSLANPNARHLAWVASTPEAKPWVPTEAQHKEAAARFQFAQAQGEHDTLRAEADRCAQRGTSLAPHDRQRLDTLERFINDVPAEDMTPHKDGKGTARAAAARRTHDRQRRAEEHQALIRS